MSSVTSSVSACASDFRKLAVNRNAFGTAKHTNRKAIGTATRRNGTSFLAILVSADGRPDCRSRGGPALLRDLARHNVLPGLRPRPNLTGQVLDIREGKLCHLLVSRDLLLDVIGREVG